MRRGHALLLLAVLPLLAPLAAGVAASSIREEASLERLDRLEAKVEFAFDERTIAAIRDPDVRAVCDRGGFLACDAVVDRLHGAVTISASVRPQLEVLSASEEGGGWVRIVFSHRYAPLQRALTTRVTSPDCRLAIRYPTHTFSFDEPVMEDVRNTFAVRARTLPFPLPFVEELKSSNEGIVAGDALAVPDMDGEVCYAALMVGSSAVSQATSVGCAALRLPTTSSAADGDVSFVFLAYDGGNATLATLGGSELSIASSELGLSLALEEGSVKLGRPVRLRLTAEAPLERCEVVVLDGEFNPVGRSSFESCAQLLVGTRTGWQPGLHYLKVTAWSSGRHGSATAAVTLEPSGHGSGPEFDLERDVYTAGEPVVLHSTFAGRGLYCSTKLYDLEYNEVTEAESFGCERASIDLDESLPAGSYIVKTDMYARGQLAGYESTIIQVRPWSPLPGTPKDRLCPGGAFRLEDERVPCIGPGQPCDPASLALPLCLCFDGEGEVRDSCGPGELCQAAGCERRSVAPYTVVAEGASCTARRGSHVMPCVGPGELCASTCLCIDRFRSPVATCQANALCTPTGCSATDVVFELESSEPGHARRSELASGVDLLWRGTLKYRDRVTAGEGFTATARVGGAEAKARIDPAGEGRVAVGAHVAAELEEGAAEAYLLLEREGARLLVRRPFEVQYDDPSLVFEVVDVEPAALDSEQLRGEQSLRVRVRIYDRDGREVTALPIGAFSLEVDGALTRSTSAKYRDGLWTVVGTLWAQDLPPGARRLVVGADHLGRSRTVERSIEVLRKTPLSVSIMKVDPGTTLKPLFLMIVGIGFDMDVYLDVRGAERLAKGDVTVKVNGKDVSDSVTYIVSTATGPKVHLSNVRLCPDHPPRPNTDIPFEVTVASGAESARDSTTLVVRGNPGDWTNLGQTGCDVR